MKHSSRLYKGILMVLAVLVLASLACSFSADRLTSGKAKLTLTMKEDDINMLLEKSTSDIEDEDVLLRDITGVDLKDDSLRVFGTYEKEDGSEGNGSYDLAVRAEDGALKAEIIGVDIEGVELGDSRVTRLNEELTEALERSAHESKGEVEFESVDIADDTLTIIVNGNWENK